MTPLLPEDSHQQIAGAVDDLRMPGEVRRGCHETAHAHQAKAFEGPDRSKLRKNHDGTGTGGRDPLLEGQTITQPSDMGHTTIHHRQLTRDMHPVPVDHDGHIGSQGWNRNGKDDPQSLESGRDAFRVLRSGTHDPMV